MQYTKKFIEDSTVDLDTLVDLPLDWDLLQLDKEEKIEEVHAESAGDGLLYSLKNLGKVDIEYISKITGISLEDCIKRLRGSIFQDPTLFKGVYYKGFLTSEEYLSGNLLTKLRSAQEANRIYNGAFQDNIDAILKILPKGVDIDQIYYKLSSPWIPEDIIRSFICSILGKTDSTKEVILHDTITGIWEIPDYLASYRYNLSYGTSRVKVTQILERLLNSKKLTVYDISRNYDNNGKLKTVSILNKEETILLQEKARAMEEKFHQWIDERYEYKDKLVEAYNKLFGYNVSRIFNGNFIDFKGINPKVTLFDYQKNAVARILLTKNTYLAHNVGAGKTYEMIAGGEELLRTNQSKKNLFVVPNTITGEWAEAYSYLYPNAKFLSLKSTDFSTQKRRKTLELIRDSEYKSIIIPHSSFDSIPLSFKEKKLNLEKQIQDILNLQAQDPKYKTSTLANHLRSLQEKLSDLIKEGEDSDEDISFDKLGITRLFVDEAHNYKNIPLVSHMGEIAGLNTQGSKKCMHMLEVIDYLNKNDGGVILASGTPITNSVTDCYAIQRYLQNSELKLLDIDTFDNWSSQFAEAHEELEIDLDTQGYRVNTRFSRFHNLPELTQILAEVCDFYYTKNSDELPKFDAYTDTIIKKTQSFRDYLANISIRVDDIRNHRISRKDDNLLKVTTDGRKAALDMRLIDEVTYKNETKGKIYACCQNILKDYLTTNSFKGTQLVFSDIGTPKDGFNVYDEVKRLLVQFGIKDSEIEFIHNATTEAKRTKLFKKVRDGEVRVLIGSTDKLGTGVNVQDRLYSIHHLSIPWRPSDMQQREGRIIRQKNQNKEVFIHRYILEGSFDAYSWQLLETKQRFINDLLSNALTDRSKDDIADTVLSYGEVKALAIGSPRLKDYADKTNQLNKLKLLQKRTEARFTLFERELMELPAKIEEQESLVSNLQEDVVLFDENKQEYTTEKRTEIRKVLWNGLMDHLNKEEEEYIMDYQGFKVYYPDNMLANYLFLRLKGKGTYMVSMGNSEMGILPRIDNYLNSMKERLDTIDSNLLDLKNRKIALEEELLKKPDYSSAIESLAREIKAIEKELNING